MVIQFVTFLGWLYKWPFLGWWKRDLQRWGIKRSLIEWSAPPGFLSWKWWLVSKSCFWSQNKMLCPPHQSQILYYHRLSWSYRCCFFHAFNDPTNPACGGTWRVDQSPCRLPLKLSLRSIQYISSGTIWGFLDDWKFICLNQDLQSF